jgi:Matrixin
MKALVLVAAATLVMSVCPREALAYCRVTTCNPGNPAENCQRDGQQCLITGTPLSWASNCLTVGVQAAGSVLHGISFEQLRDATEAAFNTWTSADCGSRNPSIHVEFVGPIQCDRSEFNRDAGNISLVLFRDDAWPYVGAVDTLGRTTVRLDRETGQLLDADIEINGTAAGGISLDGSAGADLGSILTHEAGHVLGLDHSVFVGSTMQAGYTAADTGLRTLESDDVAGICAIYPPDRAFASTSCEPTGGFSEQCGGFIEPGPQGEPSDDDGGCQIAMLGAKRNQAATLLLVLALAASRRRLSRRRGAGSAEGNSHANFH